MELGNLLSGAAFGEDLQSRELPAVWEGFVASRIEPALHETYRHCVAHPELKAFLWGEREEDWIRFQSKRWSDVFHSGIGQAHFDRVMEFARGDLEAGLDPTVYGLFFSSLENSINTRILAEDPITDGHRRAVDLVNRLMAVEAAVANNAFNRALHDRSSEQIKALTDQLESTVGNSVSGVAGATEELSTSMSTIQHNVARNLDQARAISDTVGVAVDQIDALKGAIEKILSMLDSIKTIAGQTNMLALNATIEAARAGDAGRGFAVVAKEVKDLATQTRKAADEIGADTAKLQTVLAEINTAFSRVSAKVETMVGFVDENGAASSEQQVATQEIAERMSQISGEIAAVIDGIRREHAG